MGGSLRSWPVRCHNGGYDGSQCGGGRRYGQPTYLIGRFLYQPSLYLPIKAKVGPVHLQRAPGCAD